MPYTTKNEAHVESEVYYETLVGSLVGKSGTDDDVDAFRHAYTSAIYAYERGGDYARIAGHANEVKGDWRDNQDPLSKNMDLWNNEVGIALADGAVSKGQNAQRVADALANGELITNPFHPGDMIYLGDPVPFSILHDLPYVPGDLNKEPDDYPNGSKSLAGWLPNHLGDFGDSKDIGSPLVLDLDGDGVELTTFSASTTTTFFDIDGDGFAEQTAWVGADDGFLVRDIDANGTIDSVTELFGSPTIDGFAKLSLLDSNGDSIIDQHDNAWGDLRVWQDANGDAVSQSEELLTLASLNIISIDLAGVGASTSTISGNNISHTSTYRLSGGTIREIVDTWFVNDDVNTQYVEDYAPDIRALFLPKLRGFGEVADMYIAMSIDEDLLDLVEDFAENWDLSAFADPDALNDDIDEILYQWAGVQDVDPNSRGGMEDARRLEFMEKLFADEYVQEKLFSEPGGFASRALEEIYHGLRETFKAQILIQLGMDGLFDGTASYNPFSGEFEGTFDLSETFIGDLETEASMISVDAQDYWVAVVGFIDQVKGIANLTTQEEGWLNDAMYASDASLSWSAVEMEYLYPGSNTAYDDTLTGTGSSDTLDGDVGDDYIDGLGGADTLYGGSGDDIIYGSAGTDTLYGEDHDDILDGGNGTDTLYGGYGNDILYGQGGNDTLDGGTGGDFLYGGNGADTYIYGSGDKVLSEYTSTDAASDLLIMPSGIVLGDLTFSRGNTYSLFIEVGTLGTIEIESFYEHPDYEIETIQFSDLSTFDPTSLTSITFYGTETGQTMTGANSIADTIYGYGGDDLLQGLSGNDLLYGGNGDDVLDGGSGSDILDGGVGNDELYGEGGNDTFIFSPGFDLIADTGGSDTIVVPVGYTMDDVVFFKGSGSSLVMMVNGLGQASLTYQLGGNSAYWIEHIQFLEDSSVVDFANISIEQRGGDGVDYLDGIYSGSVSENDILNGMGGDDILTGDTGNDTYIFSEGTDTVYEAGGTADRVLFWSGWTPADITIYQAAVTSNSLVNDLVIADTNGNKMVIDAYFDYSYTKVETVEFQDSTVWTLSSMNFEIWGTSGADDLYPSDSSGSTIRGFGGADYIEGDSGNDYLDGGDGNDSLYGYGGNDLLEGGAGTDTIDGGTGSGDTVTYEHATSAVTVSLATTAFQSTGGAGSDKITNVENLTGSAYNDTLTGKGGANVLHGGDGDDVLSGEGGLDTLYGDAGADTFIFKTASAFSNIDVIKDFSTADGDVIDLTNILSSAYDPMTDAITDFVQMATSGSDTLLKVDRDGTGGTYSFQQIAKLEGVTGLTDEAALESAGRLIAA